MTAGKRQDAGAAVGGLFNRPTATGGLAGRAGQRAGEETPPSSSVSARSRATGDGRSSADACVRLGVELTETQTTFLRSLGRPARTGAPRTLGAKFIATGLLSAAIELVESVELDMSGVTAGDLAEMASRAHDALLTAAAAEQRTEGGDE